MICLVCRNLRHPNHHLLLFQPTSNQSAANQRCRPLVLSMARETSVWATQDTSQLYRLNQHPQTDIQRRPTPLTMRRALVPPQSLFHSMALTHSNLRMCRRHRCHLRRRSISRMRRTKHTKLQPIMDINHSTIPHPSPCLPNLTMSLHIRWPILSYLMIHHSV